MSGLAFESAVRSDTGRVRSHNEDAVFASPRLVAVADGVGGHAAGEVASSLAIDALIALDKRRVAEPVPGALGRAVAAGNETIAFVSSCRPALRGMSTTLTALALDGGAYALAHVGDSRAYLLRDGRLTQLTRDDSLVQSLIDDGILSPADARAHPHRSVVMAALDGGPERRARVTTTRARAGDRLLICSDGLSDMVDDDDLARALAIPGRQEAADALVGRALEAGGRDNVSVVVADVVAGRGAAAAWA